MSRGAVEGAHRRRVVPGWGGRCCEAGAAAGSAAGVRVGGQVARRI